MKEIEVAQVLGVSQSAVSKYSKGVRGTTIPLDGLPEIRTITDQMATLLLASPIQQLEVMKLFCQACALIRSKGLMCGLCNENQTPKIEGCNFCGLP
jgi:predicted transcriptional regulator